VNTNEEACAYAYRLLVAGHKVVVISRFKIPAESMFTCRPKHKVPRNLTRDRVRRRSFLAKIDPLRAYAQHELGLARQRPRLLEEQVCVPLSRVPCEERRYTRLQLQPVFDRGRLCGEIGREARSSSGGVPTRCRTKLQDDAGIIIKRLLGLYLCANARCSSRYRE